MRKFDPSKTEPFFTKIVFIDLSTKINHIVFLFFFLIVSNLEVYGQNSSRKDSVQVNVNELVTTKKDSTKKPLLEGIVNRKAKDYEKLDQRKKRLTLYNEAELHYQDFILKSGNSLPSSLLTIILNGSSLDIFFNERGINILLSKYPSIALVSCIILVVLFIALMTSVL